MSSFQLRTALRYLRVRKGEGFTAVISGFSFLGITIGVATLIVVMSVMNGYRTELLGKVLGADGHITFFAYQRALTDYEDLAAKIQETKGVSSVAPIVDGQVMVSHEGVSSGVAVRGMRPEDLVKRRMFRDAISADDQKRMQAGGILIGRNLADNLGVGVGDAVTLLSSRGVVTAFGTVPRSKAYPIAGVFDVGMYEYNRSLVYMPLAEAQQFFMMPAAVNRLEVLVDNPDRVEIYRSQLHRILPRDIVIDDWKNAKGSLVGSLKVERNVMFTILTLIILIAVFNIISSQIMLVQSKKRDIGILRAMGATSTSIMHIFMLNGSIIGLAGALFGTGLGIVVAENIDALRQLAEGLFNTEVFQEEIYFLSKLPSEIQWTDVINVSIMAFVLSVLATLFPAIKAARLNPVEALRYE